jgi:hypothetical protein
MASVFQSPFAQECPDNCIPRSRGYDSARHCVTIGIKYDLLLLNIGPGAYLVEKRVQLLFHSISCPTHARLGT